MGMRRTLWHQASRYAVVSLALATSVVSSCSTDRPSPTISDRPSPTASPQARAHVLIDHAFNDSVAVYFEGALWFVKVETGGGRIVYEGPDPGKSHAEISIAPGSYQLSSYLRPCLANCGKLGDPVDGCKAPLEALPGEEVEVAIETTVSQGCTIAFS